MMENNFFLGLHFTPSFIFLSIADPSEKGYQARNVFLADEFDLQDYWPEILYNSLPNIAVWSEGELEVGYRALKQACNSKATLPWIGRFDAHMFSMLTNPEEAGKAWKFIKTLLDHIYKNLTKKGLISSQEKVIVCTVVVDEIDNNHEIKQIQEAINHLSTPPYFILLKNHNLAFQNYLYFSDIKKGKRIFENDLFMIYFGETSTRFFTQPEKSIPNISPGDAHLQRCVMNYSSFDDYDPLQIPNLLRWHRAKETYQLHNKWCINNSINLDEYIQLTKRPIHEIAQKINTFVNLYGSALDEPFCFGLGARFKPDIIRIENETGIIKFQISLEPAFSVAQGASIISARSDPQVGAKV